MTTYILFLRLIYCLFACSIETTMHVFSKVWRFSKVFTREICQSSHSRKLIPAKLNFESRRSQKFVPRKFLPAKLSTFKVLQSQTYRTLSVFKGVQNLLKEELDISSWQIISITLKIQLLDSVLLTVLTRFSPQRDQDALIRMSRIIFPRRNENFVIHCQLKKENLMYHSISTERELVLVSFRMLMI